MSHIAKIIEKLIKVRIVNFLEKYKIISDNEFGFRSGKSIEDAIMTLIKRIYSCLDGDRVGL